MPTRVFGHPGLPDILRKVQALYGDILIPAVFLSFFVFAAMAIRYGGKPRRVFLGYVLCFLLITSQMGITFAPFIHAHRYSSLEYGSDQQLHVKIVDSTGEEIKFDDRAIDPYSNVYVADSLVHDWDDERRLEVAAHLLSDANEYRNRVECALPRLAHPPSSAGTIWTDDEVQRYNSFETVRVYRFEWYYEAGSHQVAEMSETCVLEITPATDSVRTECTDV